MTDPRLIKMNDDVIRLMEAKVLSMMKDIHDLTDNQVKTLEIVNKMLTICMARKPSEGPGEFAEISDDELEKAFE